MRYRQYYVKLASEIYHNYPWHQEYASMFHVIVMYEIIFGLLWELRCTNRHGGSTQADMVVLLGMHQASLQMQGNKTNCGKLWTRKFDYNWMLRGAIMLNDVQSKCMHKTFFCCILTVAEGVKQWHLLYCKLLS